MKPDIVIVNPDTGYYFCNDGTWKEHVDLHDVKKYKNKGSAEKRAFIITPGNIIKLIWVYPGYVLGLHGETVKENYNE